MHTHPSQLHVLDTLMSLTLLNQSLVPTEPAVLANTKGKSMNQQAILKHSWDRHKDYRLAKPEEANAVQEAVRFIALTEQPQRL